jgi:hypothetical protein
MTPAERAALAGPPIPRLIASIVIGLLAWEVLRVGLEWWCRA